MLVLCLLIFRRNDPVVIAGDMNCSVGSVISEYVSSCAAEQEDQAGEFFHTLLRQCECWLPCTFDHLQFGPTATFAQKRNGKLCRPDFISLPVAWQAGAVRAWTEPSVHVAASGIDHTATCVQVRLEMVLPGSGSTKPRRRLPRQVITDPGNRARILQAIQDAPAVGWGVSAHAHAAIVVEHLQTALQKIQKGSAKRPMHAYLQESSWELQRQVTALRRSFGRLQQHRRTSLLAFCLHAWRDPSLASAGAGTPWGCSWAIQASVSAVLHLYRIRVDSKRLRQACKQDRDAFVSGLADKLATCPSAEVYDTLHRLLCHKRKKAFAPEPLPLVKDIDGQPCADAQSARQRWRTHFASMEAGTSMAVEELADCLLAPPDSAWPAPANADALPVLPDLIRLMLACKSGKAAGLDGIPNEILKGFAPECAHLLFPLLLKLVFRGTEAVGMKGGLAVWFHKGKGAKDICGSYRQILLLSSFAKILHQAVRPAARSVFLEQTPSLQLGGKPGKSVCFGAHLVRTFLRVNAIHKRSCFVLFTDIATAFYAVVRQLIAKGCHPDDASSPLPDEVCNGLGLTEADAELLRFHAQQPSGLSHAGASPWLEALAARLSDGTWFMLRDDDQAVLTARGTRPGSSWADVLFGLIIARVMTARNNAEDTSATSVIAKPTVPWDGRFSLTPCPVESGVLTIDDLVWADDVATMRMCAASYNLAPGLAISSGSLCDAFASFGFRLSFGPNKTAALLQPCGEGSRKTARTLFGPQGLNGVVQALREHDKPIRVPLVSTYRHLGVLHAPRGALTAELQHRASQAWAKFTEGRRRVFKNTRISIRRKAAILRSSVLAKLLYGAGSWPTLHARQGTPDLRGGTLGTISCDLLHTCPG